MTPAGSQPLRGVPDRLIAALLILVLVAAYVPFLRFADDDPAGFLWGDAVYYHAAIRSLLEDGDLRLEDDLSPGELALATAERQLARGADGSLVLKHSPVLSFLALPFYLVLGLRGLLVFNVLASASVVVGVFFLVRRYTASELALATAFATGVATVLLPYVYNFSADVLSLALLLVGVLAGTSARPFVAGAFLGLAAAAKLSNAPVIGAFALGLFALPLVSTEYRPREGSLLSGCVLLVLGFLCGTVPLLVVDRALFDSPFVTGYQRIVAPGGASGALTTHLRDFNQPLPTGLARVLFDPSHGVIATNPLLLLALAGIPSAMRHPRRRELALIGLALAAQTIVIAKYDQWAVSATSNRFLLSAVALLAPFLALGIARIGNGLSARFAPSTEGPR